MLVTAVVWDGRCGIWTHGQWLLMEAIGKTGISESA